MAAEHTSRLEVGTSIAVAFARSPMTVANMGWDLQSYSGGRFNLGLGRRSRRTSRSGSAGPGATRAPDARVRGRTRGDPGPRGRTGLDFGSAGSSTAGGHRCGDREGVLDKPKTHVSVPGGLRFVLTIDDSDEGE